MIEGLGTSSDRWNAERTVDRQHLHLLAAFHFVGAGLALLGVGFVVLHYALMSSLLNNPALWAQNPGAAPPPGFFGMFRWLYVFLGGWLGTSLVLNLLAGFFLRARKHRAFCFVTAAANCLHMPLGTVLGIFTIVVLLRDSVRAAFEQRRYGVDRVE